MSGFGARIAGLLAMVIAGSSLFAAAPASAAHSPSVVAAPPTATRDARAAEEYWTPERIAGAQPLDLAEDRSAELPQTADLDLFGAAAEPFGSVQVQDPSTYPNRVHGKIVGTFPGVGDYSCSGTVVTSGSGSLIVTAGHCLFDRFDGQGVFASNLAFAPGYQFSSLPYGVWTATNAITTRQWVKKGSLDYDFSMLRMAPSGFGTLQQVVGSRGIGFNQPRKQRLSAYGYPASGAPTYDGMRLIKCDSGYVADPFDNGGPTSRGMHCDQQQGASGGGWVAQHSFLVSNTSHGYPQMSNSLFYGPYYGSVAKSLYRESSNAWPSIGPVKCGGEVATIVATDVGEKIKGTGGKDVIATLGGNDMVTGGADNDKICAGPGDDKVNGGSGEDFIDGGDGNDQCGSSKGGNKLNQCEG